MHLRKRIFVNILLILSYFFYTNYTMAKASESESIYLKKKLLHWQKQVFQSQDC
jgi:hypothetical protein